MKQYRIITFKHLLASNKIAVKGEIVNESKFVNVTESLKGGFVEEVKKEPKDQKKPKPDKK